MKHVNAHSIPNVSIDTDVKVCKIWLQIKFVFPIFIQK